MNESEIQLYHCFLGFVTIELWVIAGIKSFVELPVEIVKLPAVTPV